MIEEFVYSQIIFGTFVVTSVAILIVAIGNKVENYKLKVKYAKIRKKQIPE